MRKRNSVLTVSVHVMMWRGVRVSFCLIAESQKQVLSNVSALVLKRCNSTAAFATGQTGGVEFRKAI